LLLLGLRLALAFGADGAPAAAGSRRSRWSVRYPGPNGVPSRTPSGTAMVADPDPATLVVSVPTEAKPQASEWAGPQVRRDCCVRGERVRATRLPP
jgi:hypothetical protein